MASNYNARLADGYERHMGRWSRRLAPRLVEFAAIAGAEQVLDVGCGTGNLAFALAEALPGASIAGLDYSHDYVAHARGKIPAGARMDFRQGDAQALPYADGSFDATLSLLVLNFVPDPGRALREMYRVTRPGGVVAAAVWDFRGGLLSLRVFLDTAAALDAAADALRAKLFSGPLVGPGELAQAWTALGLREVEQTTLTVRMEFDSFADYWEPWRAGEGMAGVYVTSLSAERRNELERRLRLAYLAGGEDGPRSFAASAWAVRGLR